MGEETIFEYEAEYSRVEIAAYLRALAAEFDSNDPVTFRDGEYTVAVAPPEHAEFDIEVEREYEDDESEIQIELEIEWDEEEETSVEVLDDLDPEIGIQFAPDEEGPEPSQGRFEVYRDRASEWRWRLVHRNGNIIADGGEGYSSKRNAIRGLRSVQYNAPGALIEELD